MVVIQGISKRWGQRRRVPGRELCQDIRKDYLRFEGVKVSVGYTYVCRPRVQCIQIAKKRVELSGRWVKNATDWLTKRDGPLKRLNGMLGFPLLFFSTGMRVLLMYAFPKRVCVLLLTRQVRDSHMPKPFVLESQRSLL